MRWHDLRHPFATRAVKAMPSLSDVQVILGHADVATRMRYVHHVPDARDAEMLAAAFAEGNDDPAVRSPALGVVAAA